MPPATCTGRRCCSACRRTGQAWRVLRAEVPGAWLVGFFGERGVSMMDIQALAAQLRQPGTQPLPVSPVWPADSPGAGATLSPCRADCVCVLHVCLVPHRWAGDGVVKRMAGGEEMPCRHGPIQQGRRHDHKQVLPRPAPATLPCRGLRVQCQPAWAIAIRLTAQCLRVPLACFVDVDVCWLARCFSSCSVYFTSHLFHPPFARCRARL
jgi:hypothetical protein